MMPVWMTLRIRFIRGIYLEGIDFFDYDMGYQLNVLQDELLSTVQNFDNDKSLLLSSISFLTYSKIKSNRIIRLIKKQEKT